MKIETDNQGCNWHEYNTWVEVSYHDHLKNWFAPVHHISPCGLVLIMEKTSKKPPPRYAKLKTVFVPTFFVDNIADNFGWLGGNFVCHDYGQHSLDILSKLPFKFKKHHL